MAMKYFPRLKFLFWPFEIRNGTSALACLPRIKGEPPHSADKARKPFRLQDSCKLRLRCGDSEFDAAHAHVDIIIVVVVVIALIAPKGGGSCSNKSLGSGCSTSPLGGCSYMTYLNVSDWGMAMRMKWMRLETLISVEEKREFV